MAFFGAQTKFGDLVESAEAAVIVDKYMPGARLYLTADNPMMQLTLQEVTAQFPPEAAQGFIAEIEQVKDEKLHGGQILAKALKQEGVEKVFTLAGDHTMAMYYGLVEEGIEVVDFRHESAAVLAANGYCRATGKPGVAIVTAGPGAANAFGGFMDCVQGDLPVLVISGGSPVAGNLTGCMQEYDFVPTYRGLGKWAERVYKTDRIADYVHSAFRRMTAGAMEPAFLEIPYDVLYDVAPSICAAPQGRTRLNEPIPGNPTAVKDAARLIAEAKKPVLVVGREARFYLNNAEYIGKLADYRLMPLYNMWESQGMYGDEAADPRNLIGPMATAGADLFVLVNVNPDYMYTSMQAPGWNPYAKTICIHVDPKLIGFNHSFNVGIVGTPGDVCRQIYEELTALCDQSTDDSFLKEVFALAQQYGIPQEQLEDESIPINPKRACNDIKKFLYGHRDWGMVTEGGDSPATMSGMPFQAPGQFVFESRFGGIGTGIPMAIGAYYGHGRKTILITGDGSFGFYMGELTNAINKNVPLVIVILNDSRWGMIKGMEFGIHGEVLGKFDDKDIALALPDNCRYDKMCEALGGYGELVTDPAEILPALARAEASGKVSVINVITADITTPGAMGPATAGYCTEFAAMVKF